VGKVDARETRVKKAGVRKVKKVGMREATRGKGRYEGGDKRGRET